MPLRWRKATRRRPEMAPAKEVITAARHALSSAHLTRLGTQQKTFRIQINRAQCVLNPTQSETLTTFWCKVQTPLYVIDVRAGVHGARGNQRISLSADVRHVEHRGHRLPAVVRLPAVRRLEHGGAQGADSGDDGGSACSLAGMAPRRRTALLLSKCVTGWGIAVRCGAMRCFANCASVRSHIIFCFRPSSNVLLSPPVFLLLPGSPSSPS